MLADRRISNKTENSASLAVLPITYMSTTVCANVTGASITLMIEPKSQYSSPSVKHPRPSRSPTECQQCCTEVCLTASTYNVPIRVKQLERILPKIVCRCGFGGLGVACWPLVPKFAGSNPAEAVGFLGRKNPQHVFLRRGSKAVGPMS